MTSTGPSFGVNSFHNAAALRWLSTAPGPQANTAAIHLASRLKAAKPTAYTPR